MKRICLQCQSEFIVDQPYKPTKFCNRSCAAVFNNIRRSPRSLESRKKTSRSLDGRHTLKRGAFGRIYIITKVTLCGFCSKRFWSVRIGRRFRTTCSDSCRHEITKRNSVRIHQHEYKGIKLDSNWELKLAQWLDSQNIEWLRPIIPIKWHDRNGVIHSYFPDFYLPKLDLYLDPKNPYLVETSQEKLAEVSKSISVIWGEPDHLIQIVSSKLAP